MTMLFSPFEELLGRGTAVTGGMPVDVYRDGDRYVLEADLPGVDPGTVDVRVDASGLSIEAERTTGTPDGVEWLAHERPAVRVLRTFRLGSDLDPDGITATWSDGVLTVTAPVSERSKPRKVHVDVQPALQSGTEQRAVEGSKSRAAMAEAEPVEASAGAAPRS